VQSDLKHVAMRLKAIQAAAVTVQQALRNQNCEQDSEFADCLRFGVSDPVFALERLIEFVSSGQKRRETQR
jgi:hypothetical protein